MYAQLHPVTIVHQIDHFKIHITLNSHMTSIVRDKHFTKLILPMLKLHKNNKNVDRYQIKCTRYVSGITFIEYAQSQTNGKPNSLKVLGSRKPEGLNMISKNGHLCLRGGNS